MPSWTVWYAILFFPLLLLAAAAAWRWGGRAERQASSAYILAAFVEIALRADAAQRFNDLDMLPALVDLCLVATIVGLAVSWKHLWLVFAGALQLLALMAHVAKAIEPDLSRLAYAIMTGLAGYPSILLIFAGVFVHAQSNRRSNKRKCADVQRLAE